MDQALKFAAPIGRVLIALIFIVYGYGKIGGYEATAANMVNHGLPGILLPLVILLEIGGGILLIIGFQTRLVAAGLAGFTIAAGLIFHLKDDPIQTLLLYKNLSMAGGLLMVVALGAGALSWDNRKTSA